MYFLKCILCDTPNVTYAMQECMGKIEFMSKMSTPHLFFDNSNTGWYVYQWRRQLWGTKSRGHVPLPLRLSTAPCGAGAPLFPLVRLLPHLFPLFTFLFFFIGFTYFLLLSIPSLSAKIVLLRF